MEYDLEQLAKVLGKTPAEDWIFSRTQVGQPVFGYNLPESGYVQITYYDIFGRDCIPNIKVRLITDKYETIIDPREDDSDKRTVFDSKISMQNDPTEFILFTSLIRRLESDAQELEKKRREAEINKFEQGYQKFIEKYS